MGLYSVHILSRSIGDLSSLYKLELYDNQLTSLPESICNLPDNCLIVMFSNQLCEEYHYDCILDENWSPQDQSDCPITYDVKFVSNCGGSVNNNYYEILRYSTDNLIYTSENINNYAIFIKPNLLVEGDGYMVRVKSVDIDHGGIVTYHQPFEFSVYSDIIIIHDLFSNQSCYSPIVTTWNP
jgi:hypothetical protein